MRVWTAKRARDAAFNCARWSSLTPSATRETIARGGYTHDVYRTAFTADFELAANTLFAYDVFPPHRMRAHVCTSDGRVALGATIIQRIALGPAVVEAAVRVVELERTRDRARFVYATLTGHVERGLASFSVTRAESEAVLEIQTWSRAGNWLTMVSRPLSRALQRAFTQEAIAWFCACSSREFAGARVE
jgi:uncharacterized protein (UPF0548 family)